MCLKRLKNGEILWLHFEFAHGVSKLLLKKLVATKLLYNRLQPVKFKQHGSYPKKRSTHMKSNDSGSSFAAGCMRNLLPGSAPISLQ